MRTTWHMILMIGLIACTANSSHAEPVPADLVAYYPFDGSGADLSGNGYHVDIVDVSTATSGFNGTGKFGQAFDTDTDGAAFTAPGGTSDIARDLSDSDGPKLLGDDSFTLTGWFKFNAIGGQAQTQNTIFIDTSNLGNNYNGYDIRMTAGLSAFGNPNQKQTFSFRSGDANGSEDDNGDGVEIELNISTPPVGDYNENGIVDAADYVVWRDNLDTSNLLPNDPLGGDIGAAQYDQWKAAFGAVSTDAPAWQSNLWYFFAGRLSNSSSGGLELILIPETSSFAERITAIGDGIAPSAELVPTSDDALTIGRAGVNGSMDGLKDDFAIWNRALSNDELQGLFESGLAGVSAGQVVGLGGGGALSAGNNVPEPSAAVLLVSVVIGTASLSRRGSRST